MSRDYTLKVRLSTYEKEKLQQEAERRGITMAELIRACIESFSPTKIS
ncbi:MAG: ribbon-helix-helix protein, CopG family [Symploca sp. SIO2E9]|nr:ribbon-helix-helix protein, CopG family [Symploca sp. SIO2E9]